MIGPFHFDETFVLEIIIFLEMVSLLKKYLREDRGKNFSLMDSTSSYLNEILIFADGRVIDVESRLVLSVVFIYICHFVIKEF